MGENRVINTWQRAAVYANTVNAFKENASVIISEAPSDFDTRKKIKYGNNYEAGWALFSEYCNNSTIHGIKYLGEMKRPLLERIFWVTVFVLSILACSRLTTNIYNKWDEHPVIVSFAEKSTPVWQIPFPTVTVCLETKTKPNIFNFEGVYWRIKSGGRINISAEILDYMEAVTQVCDLHLTTDLDFGFDNQTMMNVTKFFESLNEVAVPFNETFSYCKWRNKILPCKSVLQKVITEEGICYSFNSLTPPEIYREDAVQSLDEYDPSTRLIDWDLEEGYKTNVVNDTSPKRVFAAGARFGLHLLLQGQEIDFDNLCRGPVQGFKISLHPPGEVPQVSRHFFRIPFDTEVLFSVKPNIITTSDGLKHYDTTRRQCFFQRERYLRFFKFYTHVNCQAECLANFTLKRCGCVQFSMPRTIDTPVCGAISIACIERAVYEILKNEFEQVMRNKGKAGEETDCNCLPSCTSIIYNAEISQADIGHVTAFNTFKDRSYLEKATGTNLSRVFVYFKEAQFLTSKRSELYGTTDFLANCGGLLGLFMGISALSIIEIVYFCSVRLVTNLKMRSRKRRQLQRVSANAPQIVVDAPLAESEKTS